MAEEYSNKSFRLNKEMIEGLETIQNVVGTSLNKVVEKALAEYLERNLEDVQNSIKEINKNFIENPTEHMYIPISYYALYNNLSILDVKKMIKHKEINSLQLLETTLIMIESSENIYRKAELLTLRNNFNNMKRDFTALRKEFAAIKKGLETEK